MELNIRKSLYFKARNQRQEVAVKKYDFLNCNIKNNDEIVNFYADEQKFKFIKEIGPRGGIKRYSIKESNRINPFISDIDNANYSTLEDYKIYFKSKQNESLILKENLKKQHNRAILFLLMWILTILAIIPLILTITLSINLNSLIKTSLIGLTVVTGIISLILLIFYSIFVINIKRDFFSFYSNVQVISKSSFFSLKHGAASNSNLDLDKILDINRGVKSN